LLARAGNCKPTVVEEFLDAEDVLDVLPFIYAVSCLGFSRCKIWKFCFPKSENVRFDAHDFADFGNLEEELIGDFR
jgi:hypothetical protein